MLQAIKNFFGTIFGTKQEEVVATEAPKPKVTRKPRAKKVVTEAPKKRGRPKKQ